MMARVCSINSSFTYPDGISLKFYSKLAGAIITDLICNFDEKEKHHFMKLLNFQSV